MNIHGLFFAKKGEHDLELSKTMDRWEFCSVGPDSSSALASKLTTNLVEGILGDRPGYVNQFSSSFLNLNSGAVKHGSEVAKSAAEK